jgi:hypothetical protein
LDEYSETGGAKGRRVWLLELLGGRRKRGKKYHNRTLSRVTDRDSCISQLGGFDDWWSEQWARKKGSGRISTRDKKSILAGP